MVNLKFGKHQVIEKIGEGGMAEVFLTRLDGPGGLAKICIIKRIRPELAHRKEFVDAFFDEARISLSLSHGNLVQTFDFGREEDSLYLAMEYCDGGDLEGLMAALARRGERMPVGAACHIAVSLLNGLAYAHTARDAFNRPLDLVHRDISPANVLLTYAGEVKISDFGIARAADRLVATGFGVVKGKVAYLSPEQAAGNPATRRSDLYTTGIVLWEMLAGRRLFAGGDTRQVVGRVAAGDVPRPDSQRRDLPPRLTAILLRALARDPADRFPEAEVFRDELEAFGREAQLNFGASEFSRFLGEALSDRRRGQSSGRTLTPALPSSDADDSSPRPAPRRKLPRRLALGAAAAAVLLVAVYFLGRQAPRTAPDPAAATPSRLDALAEGDASLLDLGRETKGALVTVDGRPLGFTPLREIVDIGAKKKKSVRVSLPGRAPYLNDVTFKAGVEKKPREVRLPLRFGLLPAQDRAVAVAGRRIESGETLLLPAGLYRLIADDGQPTYVRVP